MFEGHGEGLIVVYPSSGPDVQVSKWKIGAEKNFTNTDYLSRMILEADTIGSEIYGVNAVKAKELF